MSASLSWPCFGHQDDNNGFKGVLNGWQSEYRVLVPYMFSWHEKHLDGGTLNPKPSLVGSPRDMQTKRQWSHPCSLDMKNFWMGYPKPKTLNRLSWGSPRAMKTKKTKKSQKKLSTWCYYFFVVVHMSMRNTISSSQDSTICSSSSSSSCFSSLHTQMNETK